MCVIQGSVLRWFVNLEPGSKFTQPVDHFYSVPMRSLQRTDKGIIIFFSKDSELISHVRTILVLKILSAFTSRVFIQYWLKERDMRGWDLNK